MGAEEGDHHVASDALLEAVRPAEDPGEAPGEARVREMALERRLEAGVAVAGHDGVDNTLEDRVGGAEGRELPEQGLEDWGFHGQDAAEGRTSGGPGEDGAPVAPSLDAGGPSRAKGGDDRSEGLAHVVDGAGCEGREGRNHRFPIADGAVKGRPGGAVVEGRVPRRAKWGEDISQDALDVSDGGHGGRSP
jgi:hypothetical protein